MAHLVHSGEPCVAKYLRLLYRLSRLYHIDLVNNLVGILYIIFNVFLCVVVVFLVNGK